MKKDLIDIDTEIEVLEHNFKGTAGDFVDKLAAEWSDDDEVEEEV